MSTAFFGFPVKSLLFLFGIFGVNGSPRECITTEALHAAIFTFGLSGITHSPSVQYQPMAKIVGLFGGKHCPQVVFYLERVGTVRQSQAAADTDAMCVGNNRRVWFVG